MKFGDEIREEFGCFGDYQAAFVIVHTILHYESNVVTSAQIDIVLEIP